MRRVVNGEFRTVTPEDYRAFYIGEPRLPTASQFTFTAELKEKLPFLVRILLTE